MDRGGGATFGGNPNMFRRGPSTGTVRPGAGIPGAANFSGGSASAMFRPGTIGAGEANDAGAARAAFQGNARFEAGTAGNALVNDAAVANAAAAAAATLAPVAPLAENAAVAPIAPSADVAPLAPIAPIAPIAENAIDANARATLAPSVTPGASPAATVAGRLDPSTADVRRGDEWARATAVPGSRMVTVTDERGQSTTTPGVTPTATLPTPAESTVRPVPFTTNFRGPVNNDAAAATQNRALRRAPYTYWEGYYWYLSPASGWQYWDGVRWRMFRPRSTNVDQQVGVLSR